MEVGKGKCRGDGRQYGISRYMPPCVAFSGDNGGDVGRGVTKDKIVIVRYKNQVDPATQAILERISVADDPAVIDRAFDALFKYANDHYVTYGREVVLQDYDARGPNESDEAMKADAQDIAKRIKPFAVFTLGPKVFAQELAQLGVTCSCTVSLSSEFYNDNPPYIWGSLPTSTEYAATMAEYIGKRAANKPAKWAGDELNPTQNYRTKQRTFGLIYLNAYRGNVDAEGRRFRDEMVKQLARYNVRLTAEYAYSYEPENAKQTTAMIQVMKDAKVTSVMFFGDPLYPILITPAATNQNYFPEWLITGSGLTDTSAAGRAYDQKQWGHAFGISPLWITWTQASQSAGFREFHHGMPGMKAGDEGVLINIYRDPVQTLFTGIQLAGPKLTSDTFAKAMLNYPRTGGIPAAPLVFRTRQFPTAIKDFVEVYYDANARGNDERNANGTGLVQKTNGGKRYLIGGWPVGTPQVFTDAVNPIATSENPPGGPTDAPHEQDGHKHTGKCLTCAS
ncbi:MAG: ABC transporter substrate-binding protein [Actinobacteria bacterium]|nr:ABC transporter substrate-binding protein [Actinomycetota bacterium]